MDETDSRAIATNGTDNDYDTPDSIPESVQFNWNQGHYNINHKFLAKYHIFNHFKFQEKSLSKRTGTQEDVKKLNQVFKSLNCIPGEQGSSYDNLKCEEMQIKLQQISNDDYSDCSALVIVVLSHGENGVIHAYDKPYSLKKLWEPFTALKSSTTLIGKPKIFIIQACQGNFLDEGKDYVDAVTDEKPRSATRIPTFADFLFLYGSPPGYCSFRGSTGSWLIQTLCAGIEEFKDHLDLQSIFTVVKNEIAFYKESYCPNSEMDKKKQIPFEASTFTKKFYLTTACLNKYPVWTDEGPITKIDKNDLPVTMKKGRKYSRLFRDSEYETTCSADEPQTIPSNTNKDSQDSNTTFGTTLAAGIAIGIILMKLL